MLPGEAEVLVVEVDVFVPLRRGVVLGEDGGDGAYGLACGAVDALFGVDVEHGRGVFDFGVVVV